LRQADLLQAKNAKKRYGNPQNASILWLDDSSWTVQEIPRSTTFSFLHFFRPPRPLDFEPRMNMSIASSLKLR